MAQLENNRTCTAFTGRESCIASQTQKTATLRAVQDHGAPATLQGSAPVKQPGSLVEQSEIEPLMSDAFDASTQSSRPKKKARAKASCAPSGVPLSDVFVPAVRASRYTKALCNQMHGYRERYEEVIGMLPGIPLCDLYARYPREYNALRGGRDRSKKRHIPFDRRLADFRDWIVHLGVHPDPEAPRGYWSIDCIDRSRGYALNNLRWASRDTQNSNRKNSRWIPIDGRVMSIKSFAEMLGQPYSTIYRALRGGPQRRTYTPGDLLHKYGQDMGVKSWKLPSVEMEHQYKTDRLKGRSTTRISWYGQKLAATIEYLRQLGERENAEEIQELTEVAVATYQTEQRLLEMDRLRKAAEIEKFLQHLRH